MYRHDGQMPPSQVEPDPRNNWTLQHSLSSSQTAVNLLGSPTTKRRMWAMPGIPSEEDRKLCVESVPLIRDDDPARALVLQGQDQSLDQADAPMLPDGPVPRPDTLRATPTSKTGAVELFLLVTDQVPRGLTGSSNHAAEERPKNLFLPHSTSDKKAPRSRLRPPDSLARALGVSRRTVFRYLG